MIRGDLRRAGAVAGAALGAAAMYVVRVPESPIAQLFVRPFDQPYHRLPPSSLLAAGLFTLALPLLFVLPLPRVHRERANSAAPSSLFSLASLGWVVAAATLLAALVVLEHRMHRLSLAFLPWLLVLGWGALQWRSLDRSRGVSTRFGLSWGEGLALAGVAAIASVYWLFEASSWKYAMIGDEWGFLVLARDHARTPFWRWDIFEASGAFGDIPVAVSAIQGLFVRVLGASVMGWKASGAAMLLLALPFLYRWVREEVGRYGAWVAVGVYVASLMVTTWARIGKPLAFFAPPLAAAVCLSTLSRRGSLCLAFLAGVAAGTGWFFFSLSAIAAVAFLAIGLGADLAFGRRWSDVERAAVTFVGWLMGAAPILVQVDFVQHIFSKNLTEPGLRYAVANTVHTALAFATFSAGEHFVSGQVWDGISGLLVLLGIAACLSSRVFSPLLLWGICIFSVGTLAYYSYPPMTRLLMMSLPWAALAGIGAAWLRAALPWGSRTALCVTTLAAACILALNASALRDDTHRLMNHMMWNIRFLQDHPETGRLLYVTTWAEDTYVDDLALGAYSPAARAVRDWHSAKAVAEDAEAAGGGGLVVILGPSVSLPRETATALIENGIPTYQSRYGSAAALSRTPPRLTEREIMRLAQEPAPPVRYEVISWSQGWGALATGRACTGGPLQIGDKFYAQGLGTHAPGRVEISFKPEFETFAGLCGVNDGGVGHGVFRILDGSRALFESPLMRAGDPPLAFQVPVGGLSGLVLTFGDGGDQQGSGAGDWVNLELR